MINILITAHGKLASGILSNIEFIYGKSEILYTIDFTNDITPSELEKNILDIIKISKDGLLILTDITGGTPFKVSSLLSTKYDNVKVIGGVNIPMVLEVITQADILDLKDLYNEAINSGKEQINGFEINDICCDDNFSDGI